MEYRLFEPRFVDIKERRMSELDSKRTLAKVARATKLAHKALAQYGEPTMPLEELRAILSRKLEGISLSDLIIQERQQEW